MKTSIDELLDETHVPLDTSWFDNNPDIYLNSHAFKRFEEVSGLNLSDFSSPDLKTRLTAQKTLEKQSYLVSAVRWKIGDLLCPYMYTHEPNLLEGMPTYGEISLNPDVENMLLGSDQLDSLRRRNFAISFALQPGIIKGLREQFGKPISMNNLGSGINIDVFNSLILLHDQFPDEKFVETVYCYDINKSLLEKAGRIESYLKRNGMINKDTVFEYKGTHLGFAKRKLVHYTNLTGIICSTNKSDGEEKTKLVCDGLFPGGKILLTAANTNMRDADPLPSYLMQRIGKGRDEICVEEMPGFGWRLNYRTADDMRDLMKKSGFTDIKVYDDANFPGRMQIENKMLNEVDCLPSIALGYKQAYYPPVNLPAKTTLERKVGYNWISVGTKPQA